MTQLQRLVGWRLDALGKITRLLQHHRLAMQAELAAQWQRADFFWQQVQEQAVGVCNDDTVWKVLAETIAYKYPNAVSLTKPDTLRHRCVEELLIDTHCAFYNGLMQKLETQTFEDVRSSQNKGGSGPNISDIQNRLGDRAFSHSQYLEGLLVYSGLDENSRWMMLSGLWRKQIERHLKTEQWQDAARMQPSDRVFQASSSPR